MHFSVYFRKIKSQLLFFPNNEMKNDSDPNHLLLKQFNVNKGCYQSFCKTVFLPVMREKKINHTQTHADQH